MKMLAGSLYKNQIVNDKFESNFKKALTFYLNQP